MSKTTFNDRMKTAPSVAIFGNLTHTFLPYQVDNYLKLRQSPLAPGVLQAVQPPLFRS